MQGTQVWSLVWEDSTWCGTTKPVSCSYKPVALQPRGCDNWAPMLQLPKSMHREPVLHGKRSHRDGKPVHCKEGWLPLAATTESPKAAVRTQGSQRLNKQINVKKKKHTRSLVLFPLDTCGHWEAGSADDYLQGLLSKEGRSNNQAFHCPILPHTDSSVARKAKCWVSATGRVATQKWTYYSSRFTPTSRFPIFFSLSFYFFKYELKSHLSST